MEFGLSCFPGGYLIGSMDFVSISEIKMGVSADLSSLSLFSVALSHKGSEAMQSSAQKTSPQVGMHVSLHRDKEHSSSPDWK